MRSQVLSKLTTALWTAIVGSIVIMAMYTSFGRLITTNMGRYQDLLLREINEQLSFVVEVEQLMGTWVSQTPRLELKGVRILGDAHAPVALAVDELMLEIDVLDSILSRSLQLYAVRGSGTRMHVEVLEDGQLQLPGIPAGSSTGNPLYRFIFNTEFILFSDVEITVHDGRSERLVHVETQLERQGDFRRFHMSLLSPTRNSWFRLVGEGEGDLDNLAGFRGDFHLQSSVGEVEFYAELLAMAGLEAKSGKLDAELWMGLHHGEVQLAANINASGIRLTGLGEEGVDYDVDSLGATLRADYVDGVWSFGARDIDARYSNRQLQLALITGEYDGRGLAIRTTDLDVNALTGFLAREDLLSSTIHDVLGGLNPRGHLERVQFTLDDLAKPEAWQLETNFSDLGIDSWRKAPGVQNASGYAWLTGGEGRVQLQSSDFSMMFPAVFHEPLGYAEFTAELAWRVEDDAVTVRSGPFTALGSEGQVQGLFSMHLPRADSLTGPEMDLMVGLSDSRPIHRRKYLPYTLKPALLDWLDSSIGEGVIKRGGFLYRGSLVKERPEHRTVQLFFDVEDTQINYHPAWPALDELAGLIVIDDADVDVLAQRGKIFGSQVSDIEVRVRTDEKAHLQLSVDARMRGNADDGLRVVNASPLRQIVGESFADWSLQGELDTGLQLELDLSDLEAPPAVAVVTDWTSVQVDTGAIGITVDDVNGRLLFNSDSGFSAGDIRGSLWGRPVTVAVSQGAARQGAGLAELDVALTSQVDMADVRAWLDLDVLRLAQGTADAEMHIRVPPVGMARLELSTGLRGVSMDLPEPWGKSAEEEEALRLSMLLGAAPRRVELVVEDELFLGLQLGEDGFEGATLGFGEPLAAEEPGRFLMGGRVPRLEWSQWSDFVNEYITGGEEGVAPGMLFSARDLRVDDLVFSDLHVEDVELDAEQLEGGWEINATTDWLRGRLLVPEDFGHFDIRLASLDLAGLRRTLADRAQVVTPSTLSLPDAKVLIADLSDGEENWGNVSFTLHQDGSNFNFGDIRGNLRGLELGADEGLRLDWLSGDAASETRLVGTLQFLNFGEVLKRYQYEEIIETNSGRVEVDFSWPGSPADYALANVSGRLGVAVDEGRFLATSGATAGTLRVVGILNMAEIVRQLSLDVSSMFQSGVQFQSIDGEVLFSRGTMDIPRVDVRGRSSRFQFAGVASVPDETVEGELVATLPLASNLPFIAVIISGLPAAAGVYLVSKLFDKQVESFSSMTYSVRGPWADPKVKFERLFDQSPAPSSMQSTGSGDEPAAVEETQD